VFGVLPGLLPRPGHSFSIFILTILKLVISKLSGAFGDRSLTYPADGWAGRTGGARTDAGGWKATGMPNPELRTAPDGRLKTQDPRLKTQGRADLSRHSLRATAEAPRRRNDSRPPQVRHSPGEGGKTQDCARRKVGSRI